MPSEQVADLKSLVADMNAGKVQWLVMLGVNPLYSAPSGSALSRMRSQGSGDGAPGLACG